MDHPRSNAGTMTVVTFYFFNHAAVERAKSDS
jgi:hypothetical protein